MKYQKPQLMKLADAIEAVQSHNVKVSAVADGQNSQLIATPAAYEADE
jgi:hypothetical protein